MAILWCLKFNKIQKLQEIGSAPLVVVGNPGAVPTTCTLLKELRALFSAPALHWTALVFYPQFGCRCCGAGSGAAISDLAELPLDLWIGDFTNLRLIDQKKCSYVILKVTNRLDYLWKSKIDVCINGRHPERICSAIFQFKGVSLIP